MSTKTGFAPARTIELAEAIIVQSGTITSSPGPIPSAFKAMNKLTVPLATTETCLLPVNSARRLSNSRVR